MSRAPRRTESGITLERIALDAQGYDGNGAYWGAGAPVFLLTWPDGDTQAIRARTAAAARSEAERLLATRAAKASTAAPPSQHALAQRGRAHARAVKARTTTTTTTWTHPLTHATHTVGIRHTRDYLGQGEDHVEIDSGKDRRPHPLSDTGYRSEFVKAAELAAAGGATAFVDGLIAAAIADKAWLARETRKAQGDLFQWADAQAETTQRPAKPARPAPAGAAKPRSKRRRDRAP